MSDIDVGALYEAEYTAVCRYFQRRLGDVDWGVADDLASEVFLRAWAKREQYRPIGSIPPRVWLYRIARNLLIDELRRPRRTVSLDARVAAGHEPTCSVRFEDVEQSAEIQAAMTTLTEMQRAVIVGRFFERQKTRELTHIASYDGVKKLQTRALVNLRRALGAA